MDFPKPQIAAVNGPAEGISITIMGLFGLIYEFFFFFSPMKCYFLDANWQKLKQETVDWLQMFSPMTSSQKEFRTEYNTFLLSKQLIRDSFHDLSHGANEKECALLEERWLSEECMQAIMAFMQRKSKL